MPKPSPQRFNPPPKAPEPQAYLVQQPVVITTNEKECYPQFKIFSFETLSMYLLYTINSREDIEREIKNVQDILKRLEGEIGKQLREENPQTYKESIKQSTQIFRALLWQKDNWPNQHLPHTWFSGGLGVIV